MKQSIDLNSDMGEGFGNYELGSTEGIMKHLSSCNIACGYHAGDPNNMEKTVDLAKEYDVNIGAHPGNPDKLGFGRRFMDLNPREARNYITYQAGALKAFADAMDCDIVSGKPHGAMYLWAIESRENAEAVVDGFAKVLPDMVFNLPALDTVFAEEAMDRGFEVVGEFYPQLVYNSEGRVGVERLGGESDPQVCAERVVEFVEDEKTTAADGSTVDLSDRDMVCIHGDLPNADEIARAIREAVEDIGYDIEPAI